MSDTNELVIIHLAEGESAEQEATDICDALIEAGYTAVVADSSDPDVADGTFAVRVPADQAEEAQAALAGDPSEELDLVSLFEEGVEISEMEALNIKSLLEANGIYVVMVGADMLPSLGFDLRVPQDQLEAAEEILRAAVESPAPEEEPTA